MTLSCRSREPDVFDLRLLSREDLIIVDPAIYSVPNEVKYRNLFHLELISFVSLCYTCYLANIISTKVLR